MTELSGDIAMDAGMMLRSVLILLTSAYLMSGCAKTSYQSNDKNTNRKTESKKDGADVEGEAEFDDEDQSGDDRDGSDRDERDDAAPEDDDGADGDDETSGDQGNDDSARNDSGENNGTQECYKATQEICDIEREIFRLTNELRQQNGLQPFVLSPKISYVSRQWSDNMANSGFISHFGFPGSRSREFSSEFGSDPSLNAENVAMTGGSGSSVAAEFFDMWKNSWGHRANMLGDHAMIGVGVAQRGNGSWYATQIMGEE